MLDEANVLDVLDAGASPRWRLPSGGGAGPGIVEELCFRFRIQVDANSSRGPGLPRRVFQGQVGWTRESVLPSGRLITRTGFGWVETACATRVRCALWCQEHFFLLT